MEKVPFIMPKTIDGIIPNVNDIDRSTIPDLSESLDYFSVITSFARDVKSKDETIRSRVYILENWAKGQFWTETASPDIYYRPFVLTVLRAKKMPVSFSLMWPNLQVGYGLAAPAPWLNVPATCRSRENFQMVEKPSTDLCALESEIIAAEHKLWRHTRPDIDAYMTAPVQVPIGTYAIDIKIK